MRIVVAEAVGAGVAAEGRWLRLNAPIANEQTDVGVST
jgi:hypothetical protein